MTSLYDLQLAIVLIAKHTIGYCTGSKFLQGRLGHYNIIYMYKCAILIEYKPRVFEMAVLVIVDHMRLFGGS